MYYLHVMMQERPLAGPHPYANMHGPFTSEQEAAGYFRKLALWYPQVMQRAEFTVTYQGGNVPAGRPVPRRLLV